MGYENTTDNVLYKIRIIDLFTLDQRDIRVRYSLLLDLHNAMQDSNINYQLPQFPKKEYLKTLFGENKVIKKREQKIGEYFQQLLKCPPPNHKLLLDFIREGVDTIRQQELLKEVSSKQEILKFFNSERVLEKGQFGKTTLYSVNGKKIILHKFYVMQHQSDQFFQAYIKAHLNIFDFSLFTQVISIFYIRPKANFVDSMLGQVKQPKVSKKTNIFTHFYPKHIRVEAVKIFSLEEYEGQNLNEVIKDRKNKNKPFTLDELLNIIQKILQAIIQLHKRNIFPNRILPTSIIINNESVKLASIQEPNAKYKEKYLLEGYAIRTEQEFDVVYYPPEKMSQQFQQLNGRLIDSWHFGVCILMAALLYTNKELDGIHSCYQVDKFANQVQLLYGDVIAEIIMLSLKQQPHERADIRELYFLANQTAIIKFHSTVLNQQERTQITYLKINTITQEQLESLQQLIQKSPILSVKINLYKQEIDQQEFDKLLQLLGNFAEVKYFQMILNKTQNLNFGNLCVGLQKLKQIKRLSLDLKGINIEKEDIDQAKD
ncbi:unnamed protein product (macronuclear) [Paramecium tetraurelia]|uniref:Protein kinase domain-containing protein n=1 Tax=Paramecium tetraurelia TaxID=5888 RepID=A0CS28_PARTE|nr:uncharacterized protein GSPATT00009867001 [Paramecium tetraurelia]CAK73595.1 unnamed protein product [Paramecium tetraurelia]|eukprot:XP_001440992.1 hypothetical protein (macronuclear) [Paramecium tetraurelia strain d4-2]